MPNNRGNTEGKSRQQELEATGKTSVNRKQECVCRGRPNLVMPIVFNFDRK